MIENGTQFVNADSTGHSIFAKEKAGNSFIALSDKTNTGERV
jgi:hypothetical protein